MRGSSRLRAAPRHAVAPEVARHEPYRKSADVFSFAMLCFELITHEVPFADKLLGVAGAMDQRPLSLYDWPLRLPFIVWAAARPSSQMAVMVAHVVNVIFWAARMPAVWTTCAGSR